MNSTKIEWCDRPETRGAAGAKTWNPIRARVIGNRKSGTFCTRISPGCTNCYASTINKRFGNGLEFTVPNLEKIEFFIDQRILEEPLKQKKPCTIFVGDMFDLFHEAIPDALIYQVLIVMAEAEQHTFQILTKRAARMRKIMSGLAVAPHFWLGVSVEDKKRAAERIPELLRTPAAVRFLSIEPLLENVDIHVGDKACEHPSLDGIEPSGTVMECSICKGWFVFEQLELDGGYSRARTIDWAICGGESGPNARPMHPDWVRSVRNQCEAAKVPFFFKQWGTWQPHPNPPNPKSSYHGGIALLPNGHFGDQGDWWEGRAQCMDRVGKKHAGHLLDGEAYLQFPTVREAVIA
jgi:protein gp37